MAETIGWLTDKILISTLKIHHMGLQVERTDVDDSHRSLCRSKLKVLKTQRNDLKEELESLLKDVLRGKVKLKVYRQFKMYNDARYRIPKPPPASGA